MAVLPTYYEFAIERVKYSKVSTMKDIWIPLLKLSFILLLSKDNLWQIVSTETVCYVRSYLHLILVLVSYANIFSKLNLDKL